MVKFLVLRVKEGPIYFHSTHSMQITNLKPVFVVPILFLSLTVLKLLYRTNMYHQQQNKWYPQRCLLAHFEATLD